MASIRTVDADQAEPAIDTGNIFAGANAPLKITAILYGAHLSPVSAGGADIAGAHGVLHIEPNGIYRYVRYVRSGGRAGDGDMPNIEMQSVKDRFRYQVVDGSGMAAICHLDFPAIPAAGAEQGASLPLSSSVDLQAAESQKGARSAAERLVAELSMAELAAAEQADGADAFAWA